MGFTAGGFCCGAEAEDPQKVISKPTSLDWHETCTWLSSGTKNAVLQSFVAQVAPEPSHPPKKLKDVSTFKAWEGMRLISTEEPHPIQ